MALSLSRQAAGIARLLPAAAGSLLNVAGGQAHQLQSARTKMSHSEASKSRQRGAVMPGMRYYAVGAPLSPPPPPVVRAGGGGERR